MKRDSGGGSSVGRVYERLAFELDDGGGGTSLSGYQCVNPFVGDLMAAVRSRAEGIDFRRYTYMDADDVLAERVRTFHREVDGVTPEAIICGSGASSQLFGLIAYLRERGVRKVFYVPPLYFTLRIALERFGILAVPVAERQPYEPHFELHLPLDEECCLLFTDPVWYAGTAVPPQAVEAIAAWQRRTRSLVFVDGSLQYMQWAGRSAEVSSVLDPSRSIRLVCPTKQLATHGYRFSYLIVPQREQRALAWACSITAGPASAESLAFAYEAMTELDRGNVPRQLICLAAERHRSLRTSGRIESAIKPSCGYFAFERIQVELPRGHVLADGRYFEQERYPGHYKLNLLSPSIDLLFEEQGRVGPSSSATDLAWSEHD